MNPETEKMQINPIVKGLWESAQGRKGGFAWKRRNGQKWSGYGKI